MVRTAFDFEVTSGGSPLPHALIFLVSKKLGSGAIIVRESTADAHGRGHLAFDAANEDLFYASAMAGEGTWYGATRRFESPIRLECPPLRFSGPVDWWHRQVGIETHDPERGKGIKVGLLDTGVGPHPYLDHVEDLGAIIDGEHEADGADVSYHGTMIAGLINARPSDPMHPAGIVPGASLYSLRISKDTTYSAGSRDVATGIIALGTRVGVDLINMSFHREIPSDVQRRAIEKVREQGVLCIASAGNESAPPARFPSSLPGVVSVGGAGWVHPNLTIETNGVFRPDDETMIGNGGGFLSAMSCYGTGLTCLAPALALTSTVASKDGRATYASLTGSSVAVAIVTGVLAAKLSADANYAAMPRDVRRADYAQKILEEMCQTLGLPRKYEGYGMPTLGC